MSSRVGIPQRHAEQLAVNSWVERGSDTNANATAQRNAEVGRHLYVTSIAASFSPNAATKVTLRIIDGITDVWVVRIDNQFQQTFDPPIRIAVGAQARAILGAGGASVLGDVNMTGFTV